jgi:hypothetical protein
MRLVILVPIAFCAACASGGASQASEKQVTPVPLYTSPETGTLFADRAPGSASTIAAAPATVWLAVKKAYTDFDIPVTVENQASHEIGNNNFMKTRQMAGASMTSWINCGAGITGDKAAEYRIYASLITDVISDNKGGTTVRTMFTTTARDMSGGSSDRIVCASTGRLEQAIVDRVNTTLGKS